MTVKKRARGYSPAQQALALCETLIAGGECLDDAALLRADAAQALHTTDPPNPLAPTARHRYWCPSGTLKSEHLFFDQMDFLGQLGLLPR